MKSIKLAFILLVGTVLVSSCMKEDNTPQEPSAMVFFVNAYAPQQNIAYYLDGNPLSTSRYGNIGVYFLALGNRKLSVTTTNNVPITDTTFATEENATYTSFIFGTAASPKLLISNDVPLSDLGNKAALRFIHMAQGVDEEVDFYIGDEKIDVLSGRVQETKESLVESQKFIAVDNGTFDIWIKDKEGNKLDSLKNFSLPRGIYRSLNWTGIKDDEDTPLKIVGMSYNQ